jgi:Ca2+-transporting ATPase
MVGGQILIVFVGGEAFKITPLNGKEWGLSIGLGAISLPWGAVIRCVPDEWVGACLPGFIRRWWIPTEEEIAVPKAVEDSDEEFRPPLRVMSSIRGPRVQQHIGFREKMHKAKKRAQEKVKETAHPEKAKTSEADDANK